MKRCTSCFRYSLGRPAFCTHCGRSFDARLCPRGHINPRTATFCAECGSGDLSTPAAPAGFLFHLSQWILRAFVTFTVVLFGLALVAGLLLSLDWDALTPSLVLLVLMLALLYWTSTLLPGPVRKIGKAAGKTVWNTVKSKNKQGRR